MDTAKKNILFMLHLPPPVHGSSIVGKLVKESDTINDSFQGGYINLILSRKVKESGKTSPIKIARFIRIWMHLLGRLLLKKPDLCYYALTTTGAGFYKDVVLVALLRLFGVKIVYHIHNKGILHARKKKMNHLFYQYVFENAYVILLSKYLYNDVEDYVPQDHVFYCPNGIKDYLPDAALFTLPENSIFHILFLSNLIVKKGVFVLVNACSILKEKGYLFHCDFVGGEGDLSEKQLNSYIQEKDLTEQVKYIGKRYGKHKEISFAEADVFVLPTSYDCFPLVILEAMQHNLPVITTFEGGIPDMVDEGSNGFLLSRNDDAEALADRLELLLLNPQIRKKMGINGRAKYEKEFSLAIFEQRLLSILQLVIHKIEPHVS